MSLIRNGGFERGNVDFWTVEVDGTLVIDSVNEKYGTYCGKYTAGVTADQFIINDDYISVDPFDLVGLLAWAKSSTARHVYPCLYTYDADYSYIGYLLGMGRTMNGSYLNINTQIPIPEGVEYIRAGYRIQTAVSEIFYFDGYSCIIINADRILSGSVTLADLISITSSGNTITDKKEMQMFKTFEADLIVPTVSGTNPTLDVVVYELNNNYDKQVVGTFTQSGAASQERITLTHCTGRQLYIEYVIGGTDTPTFMFEVHVMCKP